jgi:hypothetical protein
MVLVMPKSFDAFESTLTADRAKAMVVLQQLGMQDAFDAEKPTSPESMASVI